MDSTPGLEIEVAAYNEFFWPLESGNVREAASGSGLL